MTANRHACHENARSLARITANFTKKMSGRIGRRDVSTE
jgi:hypothetical protein